MRRRSAIIFAGLMTLGVSNAAMSQNQMETAASDTTIEMKSVTVSAQRKGTAMSRFSQLKTETITGTGLKKMACCSLAESFENSATASISYADAVSGTRDIQLLGLAGRYTQVMNENMPSMHGLAAAYGWNYVPSTWLESIQISKGASSVVGGYESIAGQINMEFWKPNLHEPVYFDLYTNDMLHTEGNAAIKSEISDKLWTNFMLHTTQTASPSNAGKMHDRNDDTFLDTPDDKNFFVSNRWLYVGDNGVQMRTGFSIVNDKLHGGQTKDCFMEEENTKRYETEIANTHFTLYNKTGFSVGERGSIGIINTYTHSKLDAELGEKRYWGDEDYYNGSALLNSTTDEDGRHGYMAGISWSIDRYDARYRDLLETNKTPETPVSYKEVTAGGMFEYTYSADNDLTVIAGMRADYNSRFGMLITPRANVRYAPWEWLVVRASAGRGYRSTQPLTESIGLMASSRKFDMDGIDDMEIEKAWNFGGNLAFTIPIWNEQKATLSVDYYRTQFGEQTIIDSERDRHEVHFYNLGDGKSWSNVFQTDLSLTIVERLDLFAAIRINSNHLTYRDTDGEEYERERPLTSTLRGLVNLEYATRMRKWVFNATYQLNGKEKLPYMNGYDSEKMYSPVYSVLFAQATKNGRRFDIYAGVENLLDYKQDHPIRNSNAPYSRDFDASMIWGPVEGRKLYIGCRLRLGEL